MYRHANLLDVAERTFMLRIAFLLGSMAGLTATADAQPRSTPQSPEVIVEGRIPDSQKRVCKQATTTGSIIPTRTCKTKAEWEEVRARSIAALDQIRKDQDRQRYLQCMVHGICQ